MIILVRQQMLRLVYLPIECVDHGTATDLVGTGDVDI